MMGGSGAHYRGVRCLWEWGQVPIREGSGARYRGVRCPWQTLPRTGPVCFCILVMSALLAPPSAGGSAAAGDPMIFAGLYKLTLPSTRGLHSFPFPLNLS